MTNKTAEDLGWEIDPFPARQRLLEAMVSAGPDASGNFFSYAPACPECRSDVVYHHSGRIGCAECGHEREDLYAPCACVLPEQHCRACEGAAIKAAAR